MKKTVCFAVMLSLLIFAVTIPGYARDGEHEGGHYGGGHYGGGHYGGGHYGGGHYYGGGHFGGNIWIGPGWGWGWGGWGPWWWDYPNYPYYPYYSQQPYVIQQQPPEYIQPAPEPDHQYYWYFCPDTKTYYPYVKKCPGGWLKVIPPAGPPDEEE